MKAIFVNRSQSPTSSAVRDVDALSPNPAGNEVGPHHFRCDAPMLESFRCDAPMLESMRNARKACLDKMATRAFGRRFLTFLVDLWSSPLEIWRPVSWLAWISLLGWLVFSLNRKYLLGIPFWDLPLPHFHWQVLLVLLIVPVIFLLLSGLPKEMPWRQIPAVFGRAQMDALSTMSFAFKIAGAGGHFFSDISAGIAFFCACAVVVMTDLQNQGKSWLVPPWGRRLLNHSGTWAGSAGIDGHAALTGVSEWDNKLQQIQAYNQNHPEQPITCLILSTKDCGNVHTSWLKITSQSLDWKKHWLSEHRTAKPDGLEFIACPDIRAFCRFLNQNNCGAVLRTFALTIVLFTLFIPIADLPDVEIQIEPQGYIKDYLYRVELPPSEIARLFIKVNQSGYPGRLRFSVESNAEQILRLDPKDNLKKWIHNQPIYQKELETIYFTMPNNPSGDVSVIITVVNSANKPFQQVIFFIPKRED